ncbi:MAG: 2'-5' RNA ligase [Sphingomonadales bacterium]|nr:2'-5' RNA ligase [Sphingomonadales bacterium]
MPVAVMPEVLHRFFFALKPDEITARRTHAFAEGEIGAKGLLGPERHHVTMGITEDFLAIPGSLVDALLRAGEAVRADRFDLVLDRLSGGHGVVALRPSHVVRPLRELQARIDEAMAAQGLAMREGWTFSPHETLTYRKGTPFTRPIEGFRWNVTQFVLVHSHVGLHRHDIIGRWTLCPPEEAQGRLF